MKALVIGAAAGVWEEIEAAKALAQFDIIVAVKRIGIEYPGEIDHWVSFHPEMFTGEDWLNKRRAKGFPYAKNYWASIYKGGIRLNISFPPLQYVKCSGGASGLIGVRVARRFASKVVLAGIPMVAERGHFNKQGPWKEADTHRDAWVKAIELQDHVKSMSGWTAELLGTPTKEWLLEDELINS